MVSEPTGMLALMYEVVLSCSGLGIRIALFIIQILWRESSKKVAGPAEIRAN